jgi:chromosome segregation ATPase
VDHDAVERARKRLAALRSADDADALAAALERAREQLETFAHTTAELQAALPEQVTSAIHETLRAEVVPVGRQLAEVRGLSAQAIRRLERLHDELAAERKARVEDLALLVELVIEGWRGAERRLDRLERALDRLERALEEPRAAASPIVRLGEGRTGTSPAA